MKVPRAVVSKGDQMLADLIELAMYTGVRQGEITALRVSDVVDGVFNITDAKTKAGRRKVPAHSKLKATVKRLSKESTDGYLLSGLSKTVNGRGAALANRFSRLKQSLAFGEQHVFHSIRKTVATLLEHAAVPESVSADLLGHEKKTMTYGLYSGGSSLEQLRDAVEKITYPEPEEA